MSDRQLQLGAEALHTDYPDVTLEEWHRRLAKALAENRPLLTPAGRINPRSVLPDVLPAPAPKKAPAKKVRPKAKAKKP